MNILILGSQGFIGSNLVKFFTNKSHTVTGCDLVELPPSTYIYHKVSILSADFDLIFSSQSFDVCINASGSGNVSYSIGYPLSDFEANTLAVAKVLDTIRKHNPFCKYLHISSAAVYGNPKHLPIMEDFELAPLSPYGYHKLMSEMICKEYYKFYNLPIDIIRPFSVYGKGLKKQLLWDTCQKLQNNKSVSLFGTGNETRDFIHISDLAELISKIIGNSTFDCNIYNAATGSEITIRQIADIFEKHFTGQKKILFSGEVKKGDPLNWKADISKAYKLGFTPKIILYDAIVDYITWFSDLVNE